jgi:hypothetical protein
VRITLFTVEEANRLLPELRPQLARLAALKGEHDRTRQRGAVLSLAAAGATAGNPDAVALRKEEERLARIAELIAAGVNAIEQRGCLVKDLNQGLVDFYSLSGDRLVFLCWKLDEPEVAYWHTLEGGFQGRKPLLRTESE